ncbi:MULTISPECIES: hypothetical protein [unclassified Rhodanobacter]|uniref:hypothetical protein n=1 Tax=unclassified Rhodanobacter TaxID=2621553 RepID=UPI001BE1209D|nr:MULTISPECIES: hypothetical protein [unclassified Rhodanobacter]MBT2144856.1 hypothetical protein [Rhodanobacter sp. LX-99]MBT2148901.1 hypothetical protein [Rhodanobacter sp. LX-100]
MPNRTPFPVLGLALGLFLPGSPGHAQSASQSASQWQAEQVAASQQSEQIMREANKHKSLLAQYQVMRYPYATNPDPAFHIIFGQYLSWYQSFIGDYPDAAASFSIKQPALPDDRASPLDNPDYRARPALEAIPELARHYRAVFFNEAHNVPLTRTLTVQLLGKLRAEGFDYFAAETLYQTDTGLQARGYPVPDSGFYTEEPIYAEMVRTALKLGFKVVAYEALSDASGDAREAEQARNIYRQVFKNDPKARLVVNAGYAHIQESGAYLGGSTMAQHLHKLSGIDPLTVEQTVLYPHPSASDDHPDYASVMGKLQPRAPIVFVDKKGRPWSLRPGYDVSVFFPPQQLNRGRPTWLDLGGSRKPYFVGGERCKHTYPCMVEARYADEGSDAIPADRLVLDPVPLNAVTSDRISNGLIEPRSVLYLRPGKYKLTCTDADARQLFAQDVTIRDRDAARPSDLADPPQPAQPAESATTPKGE